MHGSPWLRASEAIKVKRRQNVEVGRLGDGGLGDGGLGDGGIFIGVFALGKIGVLEFATIGIAQPSWASIGANGQMMHDLPHYPFEVLNRAARIRSHSFHVGRR